MKTTTLLLACSVSLLLGGCVAATKYDQAVATTEVTRAELKKKDALLERINADRAAVEREAERLRTEVSAASEDRAALEEQLQRAQERAALYWDLTNRLRKQIDDGDLAIKLRDGRMVLELPNDILFDPGQTTLKPGGKAALKAVAGVMKSIPARRFQVAGHTDDLPIKNAQYASNWELSSARALNVVHHLIAEGVTPPALSAAGYAQMDPIADNATPEGRKLNRRTEITLQPNIDELVKFHK